MNGAEARGPCWDLKSALELSLSAGQTTSFLQLLLEFPFGPLVESQTTPAMEASPDLRHPVSDGIA